MTSKLSPKHVAMAERLRTLWNNTHGGGYSQMQASALMGYESQSAVSHYLNQVNALNLEAIIKFCRLLKVQPGEIDPELSDISLLHTDAMDYLVEMLDRVFRSDGEQAECQFQHIEALLAARGLSNTDIANFFDISPTAVGKWFRERKIPADRFIRLPRLLNCSILDLAAPAAGAAVDEAPSTPARATYTAQSLDIALSKVVGKGVKAEIGLLNSLEEAATRLFLDDQWSGETRQTIRSALLDAREYGEIRYAPE